MKTTLVLLPGLNGTTGLFKSLSICAQDHFHVLPLSYPTQKKMSYQELVELVFSKIQTIKGKYILIGESFSGPVALFTAEKKPQGLVGVILVATFITAPNFRVGRYLPWTIGFSLAKPLYGIRLALSKKENRTLIGAISTELQKVSPQVLASRIEEIFSVDASQALRRCEVPIVYFRGVNDFVVPKKNMREVLSVRLDVKVVEFKAQHFLLQSNPQQAFIAIQRFAAECV